MGNLVKLQATLTYVTQNYLSLGCDVWLLKVKSLIYVISLVTPHQVSMKFPLTFHHNATEHCSHQCSSLPVSALPKEWNRTLDKWNATIGVDPTKCKSLFYSGIVGEKKRQDLAIFYRLSYLECHYYQGSFSDSDHEQVTRWTPWCSNLYQIGSLGRLPSDMHL